MSPKILAIIILYHPKREAIDALVKNCLACLGCDVFLSDNADFAAEELLGPRVIYHPNGANIGLGGAQNTGLRWALAKQYDYAILFDQDSNITPDFIENLVTSFERVRQNDPKIIAAGPSDSDPRLPTPVIRTQHEYKRMIISSGCIIALADLPHVGLMDEILFIDYVDTEWCYRARNKGYAVMQLFDVKMWHTIGEIKQLKSGKLLQYHSYQRYYYFFRNTIIMVRRKYISWKHILKLRKHLYKIPYLDHKWQRLKLACKGLWHGMTIKL